MGGPASLRRPGRPLERALLLLVLTTALFLALPSPLGGASLPLAPSAQLAAVPAPPGAAGASVPIGATGSPVAPALPLSPAPGASSRAGAAAGSAPRVTSPTWVNLSASGGAGSSGPSPRYGASEAFDWGYGGSDVVLFGGCPSFGAACTSRQLSDTWLFSSGSWSSFTTFSSGPAGRSSAAMAYDPSTGHVVLFGGENRTNGLLGDTWEFNRYSGGWTNPSVSNPPPSRTGAVMAWDADPADCSSVAGARVGCLILFGGCGLVTAGACARFLPETWAFNSSSQSWTNRTTALGAGPSGRLGASLANATNAGPVLLFGGLTGTGASSETWTLSGGSWSLQTAATHPSARLFASMGEDLTDGYVLLFGGCGGGGGGCSSPARDTWTWGTVAGWTPILPAPVSPPSARGLAPFAYDPMSSQGILYGGCATQGCPLNDTWAWEVPAPLRVANPPALVPGPNADALEIVGCGESVSGGVPPYSYYWNFGGAGHAQTESTTFTWNAPGVYAVTFEANDSAMGTAWGFANESVYPVLGITAAASPGSAFTNQLVYLNSSRTGGAPPRGYHWRFGDGTITIAGQNVTHRYTGAGTYTARVWVNDSASSSATSTTTVSVVAPLVALPSANTTATDVGFPVQFTGAGSGGYPTYTYSWRFADGTGPVGLQNPLHRFSALGSYPVTLWVNDSQGYSANATLTLTVSSHPHVTITGVSHDPADAGQLLTFTSATVGGAAPTSLAWVFGDGGRSTGASPSYSYASPGVFIVRVWFNDSVGASNSSSLVLTVDPPLSASASGNPAATDVGLPETFQGTPAGGTAPYAFAWWVPGVGVAGSLQNLSLTFTGPGTFTAHYWVNDSVGNSAEATATVTVNPAVALTATLTPSSGLAPLAVSGSASSSGGTGVVGYVWAFGDGGAPGSGPTVGHTYATSGAYVAEVWANDTVGGSATHTFSIAVAEPLIVQVAVLPNATRPGTSSTVSASTNGGGLGTLSYAWTLNGSTSLPYTSSSFPFVPHGAGNFSFQVTVTDQAGENVVAGTLLTVLPNGTNVQRFIVTVALSPSTAQNGTTVTASATTSGGFGTLTYAWTFNGTQPLGTTPSVSWTAPAHGGTYPVNLTATDGLGRTAYDQRTLTVFWSGSTPPAPLVVGSVVGTPTTVDPGSSVDFSVPVTGGVPPYAYQWAINGSAPGTWQNLSIPSSPTPSISFPHPGDYHVRVWVTDSYGALAEGDLPGVVHVNPLGAPARAGGSGLVLIAVGAAALAAAAALLLLLYVRRRRRGPAPEEAPEAPIIGPVTPEGEPEVGSAPSAPATEGALVAGSAGGVGAATSRSSDRTAPAPPEAAAKVAGPERSISEASEEEDEGTPTWSEEEEGSPSSSAAPTTPAPAAPAARPAPAPVVAAPPSVVPAAKAAATSARPVSPRPKGPAWPMLPMTVVETRDTEAFWQMVSASGLDRAKMIIFALESPGSVSATYGLAGATFWRITRTEGEDHVSPGDVDRMGYLLESFLGKGSGRAVVFRGIERIVDGAGVRNTARLLEVAREVAESTRGAVLVHLNPDGLEVSERRQLEEGAKVIRLVGSGRRDGAD